MEAGLFDNFLAGRVSGIVTSGHEVVRFDSAVNNIQESLVIEEYNRFAFEPGSFRWVALAHEWRAHCQIIDAESEANDELAKVIRLLLSPNTKTTVISLIDTLQTAMVPRDKVGRFRTIKLVKSAAMLIIRLRFAILLETNLAIKAGLRRQRLPDKLSHGAILVDSSSPLRGLKLANIGWDFCNRAVVLIV